jgi:hypothetical protein
VREEDLTAYCGLYCGDCIRYQCRASDMAKDLLAELEKGRFSDYATVKRNQTPEFGNYEPMVKTLKAVSELKCETPCRLGGDGCGGSCPIVSCVKKRSFPGCWVCAEFESCDKLDFLKPFHGDAPLRNLRRIKETGLELWAKHREKCYPWL